MQKEEAIINSGIHSSIFGRVEMNVFKNKRPDPYLTIRRIVRAVKELHEAKLQNIHKSVSGRSENSFAKELKWLL